MKPDEGLMNSWISKAITESRMKNKYNNNR
jgi:hypothetical protein